MMTMLTESSLEPAAPERQRPGAREMLGVGLLLAAIIVGLIALTQTSKPLHKGLLLARLFWQDEQFTHFIAADPSLANSMRGLIDGTTLSPPTLFLLIRAWSAVVPGPPEVVYRLFTLAWVWLGLWAAYAVLRRSFAVLPALAAVLVLWVHPLTIKYAFDARFYGPLLASIAMFCWALGWGGRPWMRATLTAAIAVLLCTVHYFGILSLGLIVCGHLLIDPESWRHKIKRLLPAGAGPLALAAWLPFYFQQKAGVSVSSWVPDESIGDYLASFIPGEALAIVLMLWWGTILLRDRLRHVKGARRTLDLGPDPLTTGASSGAPAPAMHSMAGMTALLATPAVLIVFSHLVERVMIPKYGIPTLLGLAPIVAMILSRLPRLIVAVAIVGIVGLGAIEMREYAWKTCHPWQLSQRLLIDQARAANERGVPIVSMSRRDAYTLHYAAPELRGHVFIVDLRPILANPAVRQERSAEHLLFETEYAEKFARHYPVPRLIGLGELEQMGRFHLIDWEPWQALFKRHVPLRDFPDGTHQIIAPAEPHGSF